MQSTVTNDPLNEFKFDPEKVIPILQDGIDLNKLRLEANSSAGNKEICTDIQQSIYEAGILLTSLHLKRLRL